MFEIIFILVPIVAPIIAAFYAYQTYKLVKESLASANNNEQDKTSVSTERTESDNDDSETSASWFQSIKFKVYKIIVALERMLK